MESQANFSILRKYVHTYLGNAIDWMRISRSCLERVDENPVGRSREMGQNVLRDSFECRIYASLDSHANLYWVSSSSIFTIIFSARKWLHSVNHSPREGGGERGGYNLIKSITLKCRMKWNASEYFGRSIILGPEGSASFIHRCSSMVLSIIAFVRFRTRFWLKYAKAFISLQKDKTGSLVSKRSDYVSGKKTIQMSLSRCRWYVKQWNIHRFLYLFRNIVFHKRAILVKIFENLHKDEKWIKCLTFWCRNFYTRQYYYLIL